MNLNPKPGYVVVMESLPACDFCGETARYDFRSLNGSWAYGCFLHWSQYGATASLGVGNGQRLITADEIPGEELSA
jgi:hypothetical protein